MRNFMDKDFLLETETAKHLFHDYAENMPLVDYHCHISPKEIYEDRRYESLAQMWLGGKQPDGTYFGDHYKWRVMRSNGVPEEYITGDKPDAERMRKFAESLQMAIGNPMYHWCHLELKKYFGIDEVLSVDTVDAICAKADEMLRNDPSLTVRGILEKSNVYMVGTTDDPIDTLEWHKLIKEDASIKTKVCPSFRPDKAINIHKVGFVDYLAKLAKVVGKESFANTDEICDALVKRIEFFAEMGCKAADHGLDYVPFKQVSDEVADRALNKALKGEELTLEEIEGYQTKLLLACGRAYSRLDIAMQLHYSCLRDNNKKMWRLLGPDTGFDAIAQNTCGGAIAALLSALNDTDECPKTIIYSLNPADNQQIGTLIGCFQGSEVAGKIQHGSAWWFNDTKLGMEQQMMSLASLGLLGNFIGMLTDSRSFLSYTRHDYFRRIMCNLIGKWVENGEYPNDDKALEKIVKGISSDNAIRYFGL